MADDQVLLRNPATGAVRVVAVTAVPFFASQGYEPVPEPVAADDTVGRHEATEPPEATAVTEPPADPGTSTTTPTTPEEN